MDSAPLSLPPPIPRRPTGRRARNLQRSILPEKLIGPETVLRFKFTDIDDLSDWWLLVKGQDVDICVTDPGQDVDVYFTTSVRWCALTHGQSGVIKGCLRGTG